MRLVVYGSLCCAVGQVACQRKVTEPSPDLTPAQVISAQLEALKNNHADDRGIRITFRFASPANRAVTGPVERFIEMLKNPVYRPMINYRSVFREPIEVSGELAQQVVTLIDAAGRRASYSFVLSKQTKPPCVGCWMTDSVVRLKVKQGAVKVAEVRKSAIRLLYS